MRDREWVDPETGMLVSAEVIVNLTRQRDWLWEFAEEVVETFDALADDREERARDLMADAQDLREYGKRLQRFHNDGVPEEFRSSAE